MATIIQRRGASPTGEAPLLCSQGDGRTVHSKGLCQACYRRQRRNGQVEPLAPEQRRKPGPPRQAQEIEPTTSRPAPVKADHRKMTEAEKEARRQARKAAKTHCVNDHKLTPENTRVTARGQKVCKVCQRNSFQKYHGRKVAGDVPVGISNAEKTHCPAGHPYALFGRYRHQDNSRQCRACVRRRYIQNMYSMTPEQWDDMVVAQLGVCAICQDPVDGNLHVDHDHETGAVRGLLCNNCNNGLGRFEDDPALLRAAAEYLERSRNQLRPLGRV